MTATFPYKIVNLVFSCKFSSITIKETGMPSKTSDLEEERKQKSHQKVKSVGHINLGKLTVHEYVKYNPSRFPGAIIRLKESPYNLNVTILLFSTSACICTGVESVTSIASIIEALQDFLMRNGIEVKNPEHKIVNLVATSNIGKNIDLNRAVTTLRGALYEPEIFPGLIFRHKNPNPKEGDYTRAVLLIFMSGKCVCTGLDNITQISMVLTNVRKEIQDNNLDEGFKMPVPIPIEEKASTTFKFKISE